MALSRAVSEIFNVEKCRDVEIGVRGHSRSLKVVPFDRACMVFYSNFIPKMHRFWDIRLVSIQWNWNPVWGHSRSSKIIPSNPAPTISY